MSKKPVKTRRIKAPTPPDILRNNKGISLLRGTLERRSDIKRSTRLVLLELVRRWLNARRKGEWLIRPTVPALAKKIGLSDRSVQRALSIMIGWGIAIPIEVKSQTNIAPVAGRPGGAPKGTAYFVNTRELYCKVNGSDELRMFLMFTVADEPPWQKWPREVSSTGDMTGDRRVTQRGDTNPQFNVEKQLLERIETPSRAINGQWGDVEPFFSEQEQRLTMNETGDTFLNKTRTLADLTTSRGSADCVPLNRFRK